MMRTKQRCCNVDLLKCMHEKRSNRLLVSSCWLLGIGRSFVSIKLINMKCRCGQAGADPCSSWRIPCIQRTQLTRGFFEPQSLRRLPSPAQTISPAFIAPQSSSRHSLWRCLSLQSGDPRPSGDHSDPHQPTLAQLCHLIQQGFFEVGRKHNAHTLVTMFPEKSYCVTTAVARCTAVYILACHAVVMAYH